METSLALALSTVPAMVAAPAPGPAEPAAVTVYVLVDENYY
ncbi:MAG: hypothetical protein AAF682_15100 [Planctomycetota bacterium]